jgi:hypothetical protein
MDHSSEGRDEHEHEDSEKNTATRQNSNTRQPVVQKTGLALLLLSFQALGLLPSSIPSTTLTIL